MKKYIITLPILFIYQLLFAQYQIGHTTITFQDPERGNRSIETEIYYPAQTAGTDTQVETGQFPVIVFGHGFVMSWDAYQNLWDEFVPRGYIMAFPRTEGSIISTDHQQFGWDLEFLVDQMQLEGANSNSVIFNAVAPETALMGHSMGGGAAFLAADSLSVNGNQYLKTLIGLAPAESSTNGVSSINSALSVTVPSIILSGSQDGVTPPVDHHVPMYNSLAATCKTFINVLGGAHCYFANSNFNCDFGEGTSSSGISITRTEQHAITFDFVNLWLDYRLKGNCTALNDFNALLNSDSRIDFQQDCVLPTETIQATSSTTFCEGDSLELTASQLLDWSTGENSNSIYVNQSGNYYAYNSSNCAISNTISVSVQSLPNNTVTQLNETLTANQSGATYQWINCATNQAINGENNATYTATSNGNYAVVVSINSCADTSACYSVNGLSIENNSSTNNWEIYPNPSNGDIIIVAVEKTDLFLFSATGKLIKKLVLKKGSNPINLDVPEGIYLIQLISTNNISKVEKMIIE